MTPHYMESIYMENSTNNNLKLIAELQAKINYQKGFIRGLEERLEEQDAYVSRRCIEREYMIDKLLSELAKKNKLDDN